MTVHESAGEVKRLISLHDRQNELSESQDQISFSAKGSLYAASFVFQAPNHQHRALRARGALRFKGDWEFEANVVAEPGSSDRVSFSEYTERMNLKSSRWRILDGDLVLEKNGIREIVLSAEQIREFPGIICSPVDLFMGMVSRCGEPEAFANYLVSANQLYLFYSPRPEASFRKRDAFFLKVPDPSASNLAAFFNAVSASARSVKPIFSMLFESGSLRGFEVQVPILGRVVFHRQNPVT
jgi:hypothetical protein